MCFFDPYHKRQWGSCSCGHLLLLLYQTPLLLLSMLLLLQRLLLLQQWWLLVLLLRPLHLLLLVSLVLLAAACYFPRLSLSLPSPQVWLSPPLLLPTGCCSCCCCCCCHGPAQKREVFTVLPLLDRQLGPLAGRHERSVQIERRARSGERTLLGPKETAAAAGRLPAAPHPFPTPQPWGGGGVGKSWCNWRGWGGGEVLSRGRE